MIPPSSAFHYLNQIEQLRAASTGSSILSPYGYILKHGQAFTKVDPLNKKAVRRYRMKECYLNAFAVADSDHSLTYVEGVAIGIIPTDHAWCIRPDGTVVDPTWGGGRQACSDYFGVPLERETLMRIMITTGVYGVFSTWWKWEEVLRILEERAPLARPHRDMDSPEAE